MLNVPPILLFLGFSMVLLPLFWKFGTFHLPSSSKEKGDSSSRTKLTSACLALFLYVGVTNCTLQALLKLLHWVPFHVKQSNASAIGQLVALITALIVLMSFVRIHSQEMQDKILGKGKRSKAIFKGILFGIAVFPVIMLMEIGLEYLVGLCGSFEHHDQAAIAHLKSLKFNSLLFWCTVLFVIVVVPLVEELLFRGFLQNFFVDWLGARPGIIVNSFVFAAFHYTSAQGISNMYMLFCIFVLSYLLGITYVKEKSLFTTIGMHGAFNALGVLSLLFLEGMS